MSNMSEIGVAHRTRVGVTVFPGHKVIDLPDGTQTAYDGPTGLEQSIPYPSPVNVYWEEWAEWFLAGKLTNILRKFK